MCFFLLDKLKADGDGPEEEILSVLDIPQGRMGRVIGKKGATILSIKESCKYKFVSMLSLSLV